MNYNKIFKYTTPGEYSLDVNNKKIFVTLAGGGGGGGQSNKNGGGGGGSGYTVINQVIKSDTNILLIKVGDGGKKSANGFASVVKFNDNSYIARGGFRGKDGNEIGGDGGDGCSGGDGGDGIKGGLGGTGTPGSNGKTGKLNSSKGGSGGKGFHYESKDNSDGGNSDENGKPGYVYIFTTSD